MISTIQRHRTFFTLLILGAGLLWIAASAQGQAFPSSNPAPRRGFLAPDIELTTLGGEPVRLAEYYGQPVIVNFWASWCPPCKAEMPAFQKIYTQYESKGLVILAINSQESRSDALEYIQSHQFTFPILIDEDGAVSNRYRVNSLPTTFFINIRGEISDVTYGGPISEVVLKIQVEKLLKEAP
jgi:thiol-disulfide isomerase/thioredoxin